MWLMFLLFGIVLFGIGAYFTVVYLKLVEEGTGKIKGKRGKQINRRPNYKKINLYKYLQLITYFLGCAAIMAAFMQWAIKLQS